jgi:hypothetical protein
MYTVFKALSLQALARKVNVPYNRYIAMIITFRVGAPQ